MHKQKVMLQNVGPHNKFVRHRARLQLAQRRPRITLTEHRYMRDGIYLGRTVLRK